MLREQLTEPDPKKKDENTHKLAGCRSSDHPMMKNEYTRAEAAITCGRSLVLWLRQRLRQSDGGPSRSP